MEHRVFMLIFSAFNYVNCMAATTILGIFRKEDCYHFMLDHCLVQLVALSMDCHRYLCQSKSKAKITTCPIIHLSSL